MKVRVGYAMLPFTAVVATALLPACGKVGDAVSNGSQAAVTAEVTTTTSRGTAIKKFPRSTGAASCQVFGTEDAIEFQVGSIEYRVTCGMYFVESEESERYEAAIVVNPPVCGSMVAEVSQVISQRYAKVVLSNENGTRQRTKFSMTAGPGDAEAITKAGNELLGLLVESPFLC